MKKRFEFYIKRGFLLLTGLIISSSLFGQVNFTGNWAFNETKSNVGEGGTRMVSRKITITQTENSFTIERYFIDRQGQERKTTETYTLDGKESINTIFNTEKKSIATWSDDKKSLNVSSQMVFEMNGQKNEIKSVEVYSIDDSSNILTINSHSTSSVGERKTLLVYDKR
jgi:hypothetical protein